MDNLTKINSNISRSTFDKYFILSMVVGIVILLILKLAYDCFLQDQFIKYDIDHEDYMEVKPEYINPYTQFIPDRRTGYTTYSNRRYNTSF
jgi:hypothetical protein